MQVLETAILIVNIVVIIKFISALSQFKFYINALYSFVNDVKKFEDSFEIETVKVKERGE